MNCEYINSRPPSEIANSLNTSVRLIALVFFLLLLSVAVHFMATDTKVHLMADNRQHYVPEDMYHNSPSLSNFDFIQFAALTVRPL